MSCVYGGSVDRDGLVPSESGWTSVVMTDWRSRKMWDVV